MPSAPDALDRLREDAERVLSDVRDPSTLSRYGATHGATLDASDVRVVEKLFRTLAALDGDDWRKASAANGAEVYRRASADASTRAHQVLGVTETRATADEVFDFFSAASEFDRHFGILDDMFKGGDVLSFRLYDNLLGEESSSSNSNSSNAATLERTSGPGSKKLFAKNPFSRALKFGELFDQLERSAESKTRASSEASTATANAVAATARAMSPAMTALDDVPRARAETTNPLGCRPGHAILRGTFKLPSIIRDRDFVWEQLTMKMPNGAVVVAAQSIENGVVNAVAPPTEGHVRGSILVSGYYAAPNAQTGGSTLYYVVQADPKGQLPMWVVNLVAPDQAQNVARLRDHLDGVESPKKKK